MKILHVITSLRTGGAEKLMVDLLPRMNAMGGEVDLCVFDGVRTPFYEELEGRGVKIISLGHSVYSLMNIWGLLKLMGKYDVVHTHNTPAQLCAAIANLFVQTRLITTEHSTNNRRRGKKWLKPLDKWLYRRFEKIVCVSDVAALHIKDYVGEENICTTTIPNGICTSEFEQAEEAKDIQRDYREYKKCVMVAGFRYEKDQKTLIKAYSLLPENHHLFLVGDGEKRVGIEELIESLKLESRIHLLGIRKDVKELLKAADVVAMSSHREGLSLSSLEGMASGKPFIASDVEGLRNIVDGYGVLFPHGDAQALAKEIRKLCEDKEWAAEVVKRCQERARMFDINVMAERYMEVYREGETEECENDVVEELPRYSIAIRTLGLAGEKFKREMESIARQTVKPQKVLVYIAEGGVLPEWRMADEEYVFVKRGMVAQRALRYDEVETEYMLLMDDDVELAEDSAERMLRAMVKKNADCVGADTYGNQDMPLWQKLYAMVTNLVFPHWDEKWAFKIHGNGSFSYLRSVPDGRLLPTQYVAGPCAMWRKAAVQQLHWEDEIWMDEMDFSYMDDTVESYKLYVNGGKMYLLYDSGVTNLNAKTASGNYRSKATMFYTRARLGFCVWWRTIYEVRKMELKDGEKPWGVVMAYALKACWLAVVNVVAGIGYWNFKIPYYYVKGIADGWKYVHSEAYKRIRSYRSSTFGSTRELIIDN